MAALDPVPVSVDGVTVRWRPTPWDARGLAVAATVELVAIDDGAPAALAAALAAVDRAVAPTGAALATTRVGAERTGVRAALAAAGYLHVETSHALTLDVRTHDPRAVYRRAVAVEDAGPADAAALAELVATSFAYSRFHEDPRIHRSRAVARYRRWIVASLTGDDRVWIHRHRGQLAAVMSFRRDGARVQLYLGGTQAALGPLAPMFWAGVLGRMRDEGVAEVSTRVSLANQPALRLHQAFGFTLASEDVGYTRLYDPPSLAGPVAAPEVGPGEPAAPPRTAERT
ncbi:MAG: hypothetical protein R3B06_22210 [Kofleriaceae bacterium]